MRRIGDIPDRKADASRRFRYKVGVTIVVCAIVSMFSVIAAIRLYKADFTGVQFAGFDFSQALALALAIFAIFLSALFYFKAAETSNSFYDSTYNFMKDVSEVLGRMEERFAKQLEGLEKSQTRIEEGMKSKGDIAPRAPTASDLTQDPASTSQREKRAVGPSSAKLIQNVSEESEP